MRGLAFELELGYSNGVRMQVAATIRCLELLKVGSPDDPAKVLLDLEAALREESHGLEVYSSANAVSLEVASRMAAYRAVHSSEEDDAHDLGQLALAALSVLACDRRRWPFEAAFKPSVGREAHLRTIVLLLAELERLNRLERSEHLGGRNGN